NRRAWACALPEATNYCRISYTGFSRPEPGGINTLLHDHHPGDLLRPAIFRSLCAGWHPPVHKGPVLLFGDQCGKDLRGCCPAIPAPTKACRVAIDDESGVPESLLPVLHDNQASGGSPERRW